MSHPFPPPSIKPFERLQASDGLLINAERWRKAHDYHRLRQNAHYQCLNQPGIVCGLGVQVIAAPREVEAQYRDGRWVEIQPGIAIDLVGNLIVVPNTIDYRIATEVRDSDPVMLYLVVSYVDPDELRRTTQREVVQEMYRVDEKSTIPGSTEIEICRVLLQSGEATITQPADVFFPGYNNIDLRYRRHAQARPQAIVRMAQVNHNDPDCARSFFNLSYLLQAVEALYSSLRGTEEVGQVTLNENLQEYDLLYLTGKQALSLNSLEFDNLKKYLNTGGVLLVDAPLDGNALIEKIHGLAQQLENPLRPLDELRRDHPLRTRPFLFAALPMINQQVIQVLTGGGIILIIGDLGSAWGLDRALSLPRLTIRTAQELGVNILNYAWKRRQLIGLQQEDYSGQW
ncbi:DUF4159 domain-containing protein [Nostoc sp. XA010]|uniref:DUF4159 domain-containing protein n=1 Tax=Nostoc sp. XA010 TaxID=2780407 RepID=UPI001E63A3C0|nr:DUF4159 domain-containing protein [Nostoc sp. XA010]MCC5659036.1 DUF4159 domain-containing protein [Nostoc sp. XA010]